MSSFMGELDKLYIYIVIIHIYNWYIYIEVDFEQLVNSIMQMPGIHNHATIIKKIKFRNIGLLLHMLFS